MSNLKAEQEIIGSILLDNDSMAKVQDRLRPEMFDFEFTKYAFQKMSGMYDRGMKITELTLVDALTDERHPKEVVEKAIYECITNTTTSSIVEQCADILMKSYRSRECTKLFENSSFDSANVDDTISNLISRLEELQYNETQKSKTMKEIVEENKKNYFTSENVLKNSIKTGFDKLDECLGGLQGGDITIIGARPSVGKSAFSTQIITYACKQGKKVGYFNLEMVESQVYERLLARQTELGLTRIRRANAFLGEEQKKFDFGNEVLSKFNLIVSTGTKTDAEIRNECRHQNFDLIIIDYLQLVRSSERTESRRVEVGRVSRALKTLAMELNVPIIILSQLSRGMEYTDSKEPTMADLRETGDIEQDASNIILLWKLSTEPELANFKGIKVEKNRQGELISYPLDFDGKNMNFVELDQSMKEIKATIQMLEKNGFEGKDNPFV